MAHALEVMASMAPVEAHWYLDVLAVRPEHQGTGLGRAVVGPGLARADGDGLGCYLETGKAENIAFYRAAGFEVTAERDVAEIGLLGPAGRGLHLWGMWRAAT
jgi:ribosomal protein S18 acetylase RimI-like enzyme